MSHQALTDRMKDHYSTVGEEEQREGIGLVLSRLKGEGVALVTALVTAGEDRSPPGRKA